MYRQQRGTLQILTAFDCEIIFLLIEFYSTQYFENRFEFFENQRFPHKHIYNFTILIQVDFKSNFNRF